MIQQKISDHTRSNNDAYLYLHCWELELVRCQHCFIEIATKQRHSQKNSGSRSYFRVTTMWDFNGSKVYDEHYMDVSLSPPELPPDKSCRKRKNPTKRDKDAIPVFLWMANNYFTVQGSDQKNTATKKAKKKTSRNRLDWVYCFQNDTFVKCGKEDINDRGRMLYEILDTKFKDESVKKVILYNDLGPLTAQIHIVKTHNCFLFSE
ncbi:hypothetical protein EIN_023420, partial [Entamoeba invadens IP1]|uniref:hypothetical protein n=1 Tax=Entamoeba invadens IP1 TaxID=370355 RepID=UPI0002C3E44F